MALRNLPTTPSFNTSTDEIIDGFIIPALRASTRYDRGVGFFTSAWLRLAASGLAGLARNGGRARIIASPKLERADWNAMVQGAKARDDTLIAESLRVALADLESDLRSETLSTMAWMVKDGMLEFRLALPSRALDGDFHDKFGIFSDGTDMVAFRGSPNDSEQAFRNYESISAYYSWVGEREASRADAEQRRFDRIWENSDENLVVFDIPEAFRRDLAQITDRLPRPYEDLRDVDDRWSHQREAIGAFIAARRGVLEMATGTGKTRTALSILSSLVSQNSVKGGIICAYGTDLLDQWYVELLKRCDLPIYRDYAGHRGALAYLNGDPASVLLASRQNFASLLPKMAGTRQRKTLLICDEVHGMGASGMVSALAGKLSNFDWRLGLSATPERAYDSQGNAFVEENIGPVVYRFGLESAIKRGILCEFDYHDLPYQFSEEDRKAVQQAIRRHHARARGSNPPPIEKLYQDVARVRKLSREKIAPFREWAVQNRALLLRSLIFVETADYGLLVQNILMDIGIDYHTYYGDDDRTNLKRFANGTLESLITCRRISEGIDISSVQTIVLFSTARARLETVQRLGRCLRADPANPEKRAVVVDFVRTDETSGDETGPESTADSDRRDWFRELAAIKRVKGSTRA